MGFIKPLINGYLFQFSSIILTVDGMPMQGITAVNYDSSAEQSMFYGNSKTPVAMTKGTASSTGSLTIPATLRDAFLALVTKGGTRGMFDTPFTVTVSYAEEGNPVTTDILEDAGSPGCPRPTARARNRSPWTSNSPFPPSSTATAGSAPTRMPSDKG